MAGARTEKREILPFQGLEGLISKIKYRHSTASKFQELEGSPKSLVVPVDDLRSIPRHELSVVMDGSALPKVYKGALSKLHLVVLTRDAMLRKEQVLYQAPLASLPENFVLDQSKLKATSCRTELPLEINICAVNLSAGSPGWPKRRGSRLASWYLNLTNHSKGPRFPWVRKTSEDFKAEKLPPNSTYLVNVIADPSELLTDIQSPIEELLEVWVHEDFWVVLQQSDANPTVAGIQRLFAIQVALQMLEIMGEPIEKGTTIEEESVCGRLIEFIAEHSKSDGGDLQQILKEKGASLELAPYVSVAFGANRSLSRVLEK